MTGERLQDILLLVILFTSFSSLISTRTISIVKLFVIQGIMLGLLTYVFDKNYWLISLLIVAAKGIIIPLLLTKTIKTTGAYSENRPYLPYPSTLILGMVGCALALIFGSKLNFIMKIIELQSSVGGIYTGMYPSMQILSHFSSFIISISLSMIIIAILCIIGRRNAIYQILGYMIMDNGIFLLTLPLSTKNSLPMDILILVDVLVAITIRRNAVYSISKEFSSVEVDKLNSLRG